MGSNSGGTTLAFSFVYPILSLLIAVLMITIYVRSKGRKPIKVLSLAPLIGLIYGIVYTAVYCIVTISQGGFAPIFVVRSFEGFIIDLIVWAILLIHSSKASDKPEKLSEEEKIHISNL